MMSSITRKSDFEKLFCDHLHAFFPKISKIKDSKWSSLRRFSKKYVSRSFKVIEGKKAASKELLIDSYTIIAAFKGHCHFFVFFSTWVTANIMRIYSTSNFFNDKYFFVYCDELRAPLSSYGRIFKVLTLIFSFSGIQGVILSLSKINPAPPTRIFRCEIFVFPKGGCATTFISAQRHLHRSTATLQTTLPIRSVKNR